MVSFFVLISAALLTVEMVSSQSCSVFSTVSGQSNRYYTAGGTVNVGTPCCFPFYYKFKLYHTCTNIDFDQYWCSTDNLYQNRWGVCVDMYRLAEIHSYAFGKTMTDFLSPAYLFFTADTWHVLPTANLVPLHTRFSLRSQLGIMVQMHSGFDSQSGYTG